MLGSFKQNILFFIFICLSANIMALTGIHVASVLKTLPQAQSFELIDCGDAQGRIHKCIRIDPKAGEINDSSKGASYRVIYGQ